LGARSNAQENVVEVLIEEVEGFGALFDAEKVLSCSP
jgi:hypothetical protein